MRKILRVTRIRFPFDFSRSVRRMLDAQRPDVAVLMELEVWPNFMVECGKRQIPVLLINGRLSDSSFRSYRRAGLLTRPMFARLTLACVQDAAYAGRFQQVGVPSDRIRVTGTMKFDTAVVADQIEGTEALAASVGLRPGEEKIWVCGSTGPGEEQIVLDAFIALRKTFPELRLVIVPRHPERFDEVNDLIIARGFSCLRRSTVKMMDGNSLSPVRGEEGTGEGPNVSDCGIRQPPNPPLTLTLSPEYKGEGTGERSPSMSVVGSAKADPAKLSDDNRLPVILGDTMGELRKFYSLATVVFVGRTLVDLGSKQHGSDMIEPAALAKPVIVGPFTGNFTDVMNRFRDAQAIREVRESGQLREAVGDVLFSNLQATAMGRRAQNVVRQNQGTTAQHAQIILEYRNRA